MPQKTDFSKIAVIGSGAWGKALAGLYSDKAEVSVFSRHSSLDTIANHDLIFIVVPAQNTRALCKSLVAKIKTSAILIICSKGIEQQSNLLMSEVVSEILPNNQLAILSGPNFASEISKQLPAVSSLACANLALATQLATNLSTNNFTLYPSTDMIGIQLCGALKNVLAIICGMATEFSLGENFKAALLSQGCKEISALVAAKDGEIATILEPGGIGDIFLTCNSMQSRNTSLGILIARHGGFDPDLIIDNTEGVFTVKALHRLIKRLDLKLPIFEYVYAVIHNSLEVTKENIQRVLQEMRHCEETQPTRQYISK